jgi:hypothetical protein
LEKAMNYTFLGWLFLCVFPLIGHSQERIYRCGNEYTNTVPDAKSLGCKLMEGAPVTVIQGTRAAAAAAASAPARPVPSGEAMPAQRVDVADQKFRDAEARKILEAELKKAELRQLELGREYKLGQPEKRSDEDRNPQKYQDRVAELKASLARGESDLQGIRRELARLGTALVPAQAKP